VKSGAVEGGAVEGDAVEGHAVEANAVEANAVEGDTVELLAHVIVGHRACVENLADEVHLYRRKVGEQFVLECSK